MKVLNAEARKQERELPPFCQPEREAEPVPRKVNTLALRLKEARFTAGFCRAVYAHLDPVSVLNTAASLLNDFFRYRLALFSLSAESGLESVAFVSTRTGDGSFEMQRLVLDKLHPGSPELGRTRRTTGVMGAEVSLVLPERLGELRLYQVEGESGRHSRAFLGGIADCIGAALIKARDHSRLRELAMRDAMTGLFNRRAFEELLDVEAGRRDTSQLSLLLIDIDNFKSVNDRFGHLAGDRVLSAVGKAIAEECRGGDLAARYGGEEFAVLLPGAGLASAAGVAERIRGRIASLDFQFSYEDFSVTGSFGVACRQERTVAMKELVNQADTALYAAKRNGKNRVWLHDPQLSEMTCN